MELNKNVFLGSWYRLVYEGQSNTWASLEAYPTNFIFMVAPCTNNIKLFISPNNAHKLY
jgi:hypothetical protein